MEKRQLRRKTNANHNRTAPLVAVVDDERNLCNALQRVLETEGFRVITARDGETALQLIAHHQPDVILLDIMMPGMDGREICARVREICSGRIIYFSARTDLLKNTVTADPQEEADAILPKPASTRQLLSIIDFVLDR